MPRVLNQRLDDIPEDAVYVGRPSIWGNPYSIGQHGGRAAVIAKYEAYLARRPDLAAKIKELHGKDLVCWCAPKRCHGDILLALADLLG